MSLLIIKRMKVAKLTIQEPINLIGFEFEFLFNQRFL